MFYFWDAISGTLIVLIFIGNFGILHSDTFGQNVNTSKCGQYRTDWRFDLILTINTG